MILALEEDKIEELLPAFSHIHGGNLLVFYHMIGVNREVVLKRIWPVEEEEES